MPRRVYHSPLWAQLRREWAVRVAGGAVTCTRCGRIIGPGEPWHLDHIVPLIDGGQPFGTANLHPSHASCNWRHGGELRTRDRRRHALGRRVLRTSRDW